MSVFSLFNFFVACNFGAVPFIFVYFHLFAFCMMILLCFNVCFIIFWYLLGWVVIYLYKMVILYKIVYFVFVFFLC
jgi:hypothetical protein